MLHKTKGIVINYIPYRETSVIAKIYTEKFGVQSYIENGVRSSKGKNRAALFQPLTLLDLVVYHSDKKGIHRLSEIKCSDPLNTIPYEVRKSSLALFINEILHKALKEHSENEALFFFLYQSIITLDDMPEGYENFHLIFLAKLSIYLGFAPQSAAEIGLQFKELGIQIPLDNDINGVLDLLFDADYTFHIPINKGMRNHLLDVMIMFYKIHLDEFGEMKSLPVLRAVLS